MTNPINNYNMTDAFLRQAERIGSNQNNRGQGGTKAGTVNGESFRQILDRQLSDEISFSKHAAVRTEERNIPISRSDLQKLGDACAKAGERGIKDALIVMNDSAFIVNTPNKVVITVVDKNDMNNNVFTNIDGALFI